MKYTETQRVKQRIANKKWYSKNKANVLKRTKNYHKKLKLEVFSHYSNGSPKCSCCGEKTMEFLSIDHINGKGHEHRKKVGNSYRYYMWLRRNGYPSGIRILCHNCNQATSWGRTCPHELIK